MAIQAASGLQAFFALFGHLKLMAVNHLKAGAIVPTPTAMSRRVNEAVKVFDELENSNSKADIISYNSLINCLGKNGDLDEAHMRFKEM
ncbi:hypothetical protein RJ639_017566 [Escallonia herrerae]|uniref:Pentatricopeptide repeat-containing protein n=1 Tax=Escallonia herrerae TaxID=1293975 RepID=A0AA88VBX5_9ASTE|nr:hypothetical protein RJ639_017566 [Escallonia herrerae]